jgi:hypothetical protein
MTSNKLNFYNTLWEKYLPVIRILVKRSLNEEQVLSINRIDLERAGGTRKAGYKFAVSFVNNRRDILSTGNELIQSFTSIVSEDHVIKELLLNNDFTFTLTTKNQLHILNTRAATEVPLPVLEEELTH